VFFRIKRSTQLKKLMNAYCDRQSVDMNAIAFLFDGRRLRGEQTPDEVWCLLCLLSFAYHRNVMNPWLDLIFCICKILFQLEMEDGDEIDAMLHQTGGFLPNA
jgi:hypothetical protein